MMMSLVGENRGCVGSMSKPSKTNHSSFTKKKKIKYCIHKNVLYHENLIGTWEKITVRIEFRLISAYAVYINGREKKEDSFSMFFFK